MGTLVYVCPISGEEVSTGIKIDTETFGRLRSESVRCPYCQQLHRLADLAASLVRDDDDAPNKAA
jgi:hypothetical protein